MSPLVFIAIAITVVAAYILKSIAGFGTSLLLVPVLSLVFGIKEAIVLAALGDVVSSAILTYRDASHTSLFKLKDVGISLAIGTAVGVSLLNYVNAGLLQQFLAIFILLYLIVQQINPTFSKASPRAKKILGYVLGFIGGICGGIFNTNGPALFVYVRSFFPTKETVRANLILLFFIDSIWRTGLMAWNGLISSQLVTSFTLLILPSLLLGIYAGTHIDKKLHSEHYTFISKAILVLSGLKLLLLR